MGVSDRKIEVWGRVPGVSRTQSEPLGLTDHAFKQTGLSDEQVGAFKKMVRRVKEDGLADREFKQADLSEEQEQVSMADRTFKQAEGRVKYASTLSMVCEYIYKNVCQTDTHNFRGFITAVSVSKLCAYSTWHFTGTYWVLHF